MFSKKLISLLILCALVSCKKDSPGFLLVWHYEYTKPAESLSLVKTIPKIVKDGILIAPDEQFTLIDISTGRAKWQLELQGGPYIYTAKFLIDSDNLFVKEDQYHNLYSIDLTTGKVNWQVDISPDEFFQHSNDAYDEDYLYLNGAHGEIFKYTKAGDLEREYDILKYGVRDRARSIHVVNNQLIFSQRWRGTDDCARTCGRILSIHKESEEVLWEYRTDQGGYIFEPILLEDGVIYAGVTDGPGEFVALDATNGEVVWKTDGVVSHSYTLTDSMVLVNDGGSLLALDKLTGKELWNTGSAFGGHGQANIGYWNGYVYHYHSGSRFWILDGQTGEAVHEGTATSPDGSLFYLLTVGGDGKIYIQSDYALYAYTAWR